MKPHLAPYKFYIFASPSFKNSSVVTDFVIQSTLQIPEPPPEMIASGDYEKIMNVEKKQTAEGKKEGQ